MSGRHSRNKGSRAELALVKFLQAEGFAAEKLSRMYRPGPDLSVPLLGRDLAVEVKIRSDGFRELYRWLDGGADLLIVRADRCEPLVVIPLRLAAEIALAAELFLDNHKAGSSMGTLVRDAAIILSFALQHGADLAAVRKALGRDGRGSALSPIGTALDLLADNTNKEAKK
jgi:Holliday junction resolvase